MNEDFLKEKANAIRRLCVESLARTRSSHVGSVLSMADLVTYLFYEKMDHQVDRFILSKGHAVAGLYAVLYDRGILTREEFDSYHTNDSYLLGHANHMVNGIEVSTGSLGHGPAIAAGLAWAYKMDDKPGTIYCLLGDGECQEGSVWEALIFISRHNLNNLVVIIDANGYQGYSDPCDSLFSERKLIGMLQGTGLEYHEIDGHNFSEIHAALQGAGSMPRVLFAHTLKGKGVSYMESKFEWHYKSPDPDQLSQALEELT